MTLTKVKLFIKPIIVNMTLTKCFMQLLKEIFCEYGLNKIFHVTYKKNSFCKYDLNKTLYKQFIKPLKIVNMTLNKIFHLTYKKTHFVNMTLTKYCKTIHKTYHCEYDPKKYFLHFL